MRRVAEAEHVPVCLGEPVSVPVGHRRHGNYQLSSVARSRRAVVPGVAEVEDPPGPERDPVALGVGSGHDRDDVACDR